MTSLWEPGELVYGLRRGFVSTYAPATATFGTPVRVPSIKTLSYKLNMKSAVLEGDDAETAVSSRITSVDIAFEMGGLSLAVVSTMLGGAVRGHTYGGDIYRGMHFSNRRTSYFSVYGLALDDENVGQLAAFAPKCKVMEGFDLKFEYGAFTIPNLQCRASLDENFEDEDGNSDAFYIVTHNFQTPNTIPTFPPLIPQDAE